MKKNAAGTALGVILLSLAGPALRGKDFVYRGTDCEIIFRFTAKTGTLHDLQVIVNGGSPCYPSNYGGAMEVRLAGEKLWNWEGKYKSELLSESDADGVYTASFRWTYKDDSLDFSVRIWREKKTLKSEWTSPSAKISIFSLDRTEDTSQPKIVELPYGHSVLFVNGMFISARLDPAVSNASEIWPMREVYSGTSAFFSDCALYKTTTDGRRRTLKEKIEITVSPEIADTFFVPRNAVSPYRKTLSRYYIADFWSGDFAWIKSRLDTFVSEGMKNLWVIVHNWQKYGYDNGLPTTYPASEALGGPAGIKAVADLCARRGFLFGLHTNYVDFYKNSDEWDPAGLALDSAGRWIKAWFNPETKRQSYLMKPSRALRYAKAYEPLIHRYYRTTSAFLDVHSAILPSAKVDFDAKVANAGKQASTFALYRDLIAYTRKTHAGPVAGEGKGTPAAVWAGLIDAVEADPRSWFQEGDRDPEGSNVPTIVDYKLKVLHRLFVPHGVGYFPRFFKSKRTYSASDFARYLATELAFGNAAYFDQYYLWHEGRAERLKKYGFLSVLQKNYLDAEIKTIGYFRNGGCQTLSQALKAVLPGCSAARVQSTLCEELGILKLEYSKAFMLYVNRSKGRTLKLKIDGVGYTLHPNDFLALKSGRPLAYAAEREGAHRDWVAVDMRDPSP